MIWYRVSFDNENVYINILKTKEPDEISQFKWKDIIRVCYKAWSYYKSDEIYIFTKNRSESYVIPTEGIGGPELWGEIVRRELYDEKLTVKGPFEKEGELNCWPIEKDKFKE